MGLRWLTHPEPWMLDKIANEQILKESFQELFNRPGNDHLSRYLLNIYKFFGLWVSSIGMLTIIYTYLTRLGTPLSRSLIHTVYFILLIGATYLLIIFIPLSHFKYLAILFWVLLFISFGSGIQLKKFDK
tara:strand:- start:1094 stop:1483 length:390 start_codon:yes stop_codon:yes gene_type:complete